MKPIRTWGNLQDEILDFGAMRIGSGRALALEDPQGAQWSVPMAKTWTVAEGRTFLVESVQFAAVQAQINALPAPPLQGAAVKKAGAVRQMALNAIGQRLFPARKQAAKVGGKIQMAAAPSPLRWERAGVRDQAALNIQPSTLNSSRGLVLDYALVQTTSNFTFRGDTTYFLSGNCSIGGTNILEGGAVIKSSNGVTLTFTGPLETRTSSYLPAVCTSWCDDTVGEIITGSTGNPWTNQAANVAIYLDAYAAGGSSTLSHLRVAHAAIAFYFFNGRSHELNHVQIVHCGGAFKHY